MKMGLSNIPREFHIWLCPQYNLCSITKHCDEFSRAKVVNMFSFGFLQVKAWPIWIKARAKLVNLEAIV